MSTARIHKRKKPMRIFAIAYLLLSTITLSSCGYEVDEPPTVDGGNPPVIRYPIDTVGGPIYIYGPYTLEQLKQDRKIVAGEKGLTESQKEELNRIYGDKNYLLWEVDPLGAHVPFITYGIVPETYKQVYPANGKPEDLKEGMIYEAMTPPRYRNNGVTAYFTITNGKAKTITDDELNE